MIILRNKNFSNLSDSIFYLANLRNFPSGTPKFVFDFIKGPQQILKGGHGLCDWSFPVISMPSEPITIDDIEDYEFFGTSVQDSFSLPLVWKDGKWFEKKGLFFKKYIPVSDPAAWLCDYIARECDGEYEEDNKKNSDYDQWMKARESLKKMIGKYK